MYNRSGVGSCGPLFFLGGPDSDGSSIAANTEFMIIIIIYILYPNVCMYMCVYACNVGGGSIAPHKRQQQQQRQQQ